MIATQRKEPRYLVEFSDGACTALSDAAPAKGGQGAGFGPHELLEASLACCINMWIRMQADKAGIPVGPIAVSVSLKRDHPEEATFQCAIKLDDQLSPAHRSELLAAADTCPVRKTLLKRLIFQTVEA